MGVNQHSGVPDGTGKPNDQNVKSLRLIICDCPWVADISLKGCCVTFPLASGLYSVLFRYVQVFCVFSLCFYGLLRSFLEFIPSKKSCWQQTGASPRDSLCLADGMPRTRSRLKRQRKRKRKRQQNRKRRQQRMPKRRRKRRHTDGWINYQPSSGFPAGFHQIIMVCIGFETGLLVWNSEWYVPTEAMECKVEVGNVKESVQM